MALPTKELIETGWLRDALTRALTEPNGEATAAEQFAFNIMNNRDKYNETFTWPKKTISR